MNRRVVDQMLVGVATRQYARSLGPVPAGVVSRGTSKSSVSRRFVARTTAQLRAWQSAPLDGLDLVALILDGVHIGEHCLVVALGIAADGQKHELGLWDGATENAAVCQSLLANLQSRGLRTDRSSLVILDGALALHKATRAVFSEAALIQRCQVHKLRNILDHLPERHRPWVQAVVRRAYQATEFRTATRLLTDLAKRLEDEYPSAAGSVREGLEETLAVLTLQLSARLQRSLATTLGHPAPATAILPKRAVARRSSRATASSIARPTRSSKRSPMRRSTERAKGCSSTSPRCPSSSSTIESIDQPDLEYSSIRLNT
ncbi:MAG TPA: transposase [Vicinamibacterales bacterium]|nr:transposase [Vicinamibacterales bacterium]